MIDSPMKCISHCLGLHGHCNPKNADPDWMAVEKIIEVNPESAMLQCGSCGIFYPLNIAICNELSPVPARIVDMLIVANPDVFTDDTFSIACSNHSLPLDVFEVLLSHDKSLLSPWSLRKVAIHDNQKLAQYIIHKFPYVLPRTVGDWALIYGNAIQQFWLRVMLSFHGKASENFYMMSEENVVKIKLLHYFISQSNLMAVRMLVERFPDTLSSSNMGRLPIHEALSNYSGRVYGWNSELAQYLLEEGQFNNVGLDYGGYGGLFVPDSEGKTPLASSIELIRNLLFSHDWGERWECLMVCIRFLDREYSCGDADNNSIFHAALNTIPFAVDVLDVIAERHGANPMFSGTNPKSTIFVAIESLARLANTPSPYKAKERDTNKLSKALFKRLLGKDCYKGAGPHLARDKNKNGCTPLARAAALGVTWFGGLSEILDADNSALLERDPGTGLHPFMLAAMGAECSTDLNAAYEMLKRNVTPLLSIN